jgi:CRP-like cAMP-binding protein
MSPNRILSHLAPADFGLLQPHLQAVELPLRRELEMRNKRIGYVYFIESGFASVVANGSTKPGIEIGIIGREGMTGSSVVLASNDRAAHDTYMQLAGNGQRLRVANLREAIMQSVDLHHVLLRYVRSFLLQTASTALANGRSTIEERLARWLLMAQDRLDGDQVPLTHEFLSVMLGVRRPGVTIALQALERDGLIAHRRGVITILYRKGLEAHSNGIYVPLSDNY